MRFVLPVLVLGACGAVAWYLVNNQVEAEKRKSKPPVIAIEVMDATLETKRLFVDAYGSVRPRTVTTLITQAAGRIEGVAPFGSREANRTGPVPSFRPGGFFDKGDLLVKIEDLHHIAAVAEAEAAFSRAELQLKQEQALADQAKEEWELDRDWANAPELVKRIPQINKAEAEANATKSRLAQALQTLERTEVRAPYRGRLLETMADVGQQVGGGSSPILATAYSLDSAEILLSLSKRSLDLLAFNETKAQGNSRIEVIVMEEGNSSYTGYLDRAEGTIDPRTQLIRVVARVDGALANPFENEGVDLQGPLMPGQFVEVRLLGPEVSVFPIPSSALRNRNAVLVLDENNRLFRREVSIARWDGEIAWVKEGLREGEKVCLTPIGIFAAGMEAQPVSNRK